MKSVKYLLDLQERRRLTDTALANLLGISQPAVSQYKNGKRVMDDETCLAVALQLEIDPMQVLGAAFLDRAEKTGQRSLWEVFMNRAAATAGAVLVASSVNVFLTPNPANAASMRVLDAPISSSIDYAKLGAGRRRRLSDLRKRTVSAWFERLFGATALVPTAS